MDKIINAQNLRMFAYVNDALLTRPARGIAVEFMGLGGQSMCEDETPRGRLLAEAGILFIIPYLNPWAWMNPQAVRETDEIIEAALAKIGARDIPIVSTGGSMGGQSALVYTSRARVTPVACVANCPVCDLPYHFTERPDLPRTLYSAFGEADSIERAMRGASPLHLAKEGAMPRAKYTIFHCEEDMAVNKRAHSDKFVAAMRPAHDIEYVAVPGRGHCDLTEETRALYDRRIIEAVDSAEVKI